jgi:TolA-binding protein
MAGSARAPPSLTHQSDEKGRLDACVAALERQIEELEAKVEELEAALERKAGATTETLEDSEVECQRRVTCRRVRIVAPDDRERAAVPPGQEKESHQTSPGSTTRSTRSSATLERR